MEKRQQFGADFGYAWRSQDIAPLALLESGNSQQAAVLMNCSIATAERRLCELAQAQQVRLNPATDTSTAISFSWIRNLRASWLQRLHDHDAALLPDIFLRAEPWLRDSPLEQWTARALKQPVPAVWAILLAGRMCRRWLRLHDSSSILQLLDGSESVMDLRCANLKVCAIWALIMQQQLELAGRWLHQLDAGSLHQDPLQPLSEVGATVDTLRMWLGYYRDGNITRATRLTLLESCMELPTLLQPILLNQYAVLQYSSGNIESAYANAERAARHARALGNLVQYQLGRGWMMAAQFMLGNGLVAWLQLQADAAELEQLRALTVDQSDPALEIAGAIHQACQAFLCYEANQINEAQALLTQAMASLGKSDLGLPKLLASITQAKLFLGRDEFARAEALLCALDALPESQRNPRIQAIIGYERMRARLSIGDRADDLIAHYQLQSRCVRVETLFQDTYQEEHLFWLKSKLVAYLMDEDFAAASEFALKGVIKSMGLNCRRHLATFYLFKALSEFKLKREADATDSFNQALLLCQQAGYRRVLVDDGMGLRDLWVQMRAKRQFLPQLTSAFLQSVQQDLQVVQPLSTAKQVASRLVGADRLLSLTEKEIEILKLLAEGLCNKKIAHRASIALTTVKWHLQNIFSKLEARNRTEAVLKAQEMQLVDSLGVSR